MGALLTGCGVQYGIDGHRAYSSKAESSPSSRYPTLIIEKGDTIRAVTPAKGPMFGGYWHAIYVENPEVARHLPRDSDFMHGTDIEAIEVGETKAYYLNSVYLPRSGVAIESTYTERADWFWIKVVQSDSNR